MEGPQKGQVLWDDLEADLPSIASQAAIELDNLILSRSLGLVVVRKLAKMIEDSLESISDPGSPESLLDPTTALVMNSAMTDAHVSAEPLKKLSDLVSQSTRVRESLEGLTASTPKPELEKMRAFCIALSKRASECLPPRDEVKPGHPNRF